MEEIRLGETAVPSLFSEWAWISRTVVFRAYSEMTLPSKPLQRVWCLGMRCGAKIAWRSRATATGNSPNAPLLAHPAPVAAGLLGSHQAFFQPRHLQAASGQLQGSPHPGHTDDDYIGTGGARIVCFHPVAGLAQHGCKGL